MLHGCIEQPFTVVGWLELILTIIYTLMDRLIYETAVYFRGSLCVNACKILAEVQYYLCKSTQLLSANIYLCKLWPNLLLF